MTMLIPHRRLGILATTAGHLDGYPPQVAIVRPRHAFEGKTLELLGWTHRRGELLLTLVLPDGTRSLIPAAWTDLQAQKTPVPPKKRPQTALLVSCTQLLQARIVVDALLRRLSAASSSQPETPQETVHAHAAAKPSRHPTAGKRRPRVERARQGVARRAGQQTRPVNRKNP
ncbi:MAG: hypothetical protein ACYCXT_04520 [Acidiferrobacteraceae bacterium]